VGYRGRKRLRLNHNKGGNYYPCDLVPGFAAKISKHSVIIGTMDASFECYSHKPIVFNNLRLTADFVKNYTNWDLGSLTIDFHAVTLLPR